MGQKEDNVPVNAQVPSEDGQTEENATENNEVEGTETTETEGTENSSTKDSESEALKAQIANLEKVLGKQGKELGDLRKQNTQSTQQKEEPKDYDALEADIVDKLDAGELDLKSALRQMNQLASERGAMQATAQFAEEQNKERSQKAISQFKQENPDFDDVLESGALDGIIEKNPLHDEFSAYQEYKRNELQKDLESKLEQARNEGRETGMKIANESENPGKVLGKKGDSTRTTQKPKQYQNRDETRSAMMDALKTARSGD